MEYPPSDATNQANQARGEHATNTPRRERRLRERNRASKEQLLLTRERAQGRPPAYTGGRRTHAPRHVGGVASIVGRGRRRRRRRRFGLGSLRREGVVEAEAEDDEIIKRGGCSREETGRGVVWTAGDARGWRDGRLDGVASSWPAGY
jgi:hypothetical protein